MSSRHFDRYSFCLFYFSGTARTSRSAVNSTVMFSVPSANSIVGGRGNRFWNSPRDQSLHIPTISQTIAPRSNFQRSPRNTPNKKAEAAKTTPEKVGTNLDYYSQLPAPQQIVRNFLFHVFFSCK